MSKDNEAIARQAFKAILSQFPHLTSSEEENPNVDVSILMPVQEGLKYDVWLAFQNDDELHFGAGHFWLEWFPCTDSVRRASYIDAVSGFLSGRNRILEHYREATCFKAELQKPSKDSWETIGTWSRLRWPSLRRATLKEVVNA